MTRKEKLDHKCIICGELYHACDNCERVREYTPWKVICDTHKHYEIYLAIKSYQAEHEPIEVIRENLQIMGVTKDMYKNWPDAVKRILDEIFFVPAIPKKTRKVAVEAPAPIADEIVEE